MSKCVATGGAGFIGSHLVERRWQVFGNGVAREVVSAAENGQPLTP